MAKAVPKGVPNPFASAQRVAPASASKVAGNIYVASNLTAFDGSNLTTAQVVESVKNYSQGKELADQSKALLENNRPTVLKFAETKFAQQWLMSGGRPDNPRIVIDSFASGPQLQVAFLDSCVKLDENRYSVLESHLGPVAAEENVVKRDQFFMNPELLEEVVEVNSNGKRVKMRVMDAVAEALQVWFAPSPEILTSLFSIKPIFTTKKGMIDRAPSILCPDKSPASAVRLAQFIQDLVTVQIKVGGS